METLKLARKLATYTIHICSNEKNFPKRYRWCLTGKIVECAVDIGLNVEMANSVLVQTHEDYVLRRNYQTRALAETYSLNNMIEISKMVFGIESDRAAYWSSMVIELQAMIRNWRKSEKAI